MSNYEGSHAFRMGRWDARRRLAPRQYTPGTFAAYDYDEGYRDGVRSSLHFRATKAEFEAAMISLASKWREENRP